MVTNIYVFGFIVVALVVSFGYIIANLMDEDGLGVSLPLAARGVVLGVAAGIAWPVVIAIIGFLYVVNHHIKEFDNEQSESEEDL